MFSMVSINPKLRKNFLVLLRANIIVQLISFLTIPIISRLFDSEDFGVLAIYAALVAILASVSTLRFDWLVPLVKSNFTAIYLFNFGIIFAFLFSLVSGGLFYSGILNVGPPSLKVLNSIWFLIPFGVFFLSAFNLLKGWATRTGDLKVVAKLTLHQAFVKVFCNIFLGLSGFTSFGLIISLIGSRAVGLLLSFKLFHKHLPSFFSSFLRSRKIFSAVIKRALLSTCISFFNTVSTNIMILALAIHYSSSELGLLAFANRIVAAPLSTASRALSQSFRSRAAELSRSTDYIQLRKEYLFITFRLVICSLFVVFLIGVISQFTGLIFGANWVEAGSVLVCMIPLFLGTIIFVPTNHLIALQKPQLQLYADLSRVALILLSIIFSVYFKLSFLIAVFLCCSASLVGYLLIGALHLYSYFKLNEISDFPKTL